MTLHGDLDSFTPSHGMAVTFGVFDGVHRGHQQLISQVVEYSRANGLASAVITFHPHPRTILRPQEPVPPIMTHGLRVRLLAGLGVDHVVTMRFTRQLSLLTPEEYLDLLGRHLAIQAMLIGPDFALGHHRAGTPPVLTALGQQRGFRVIVIPEIDLDNEKVSSTRVRDLIGAGNVELAGRLLGRYHVLEGLLHPGGVFKLAEPLLLPPAGSYAAFLESGGGMAAALLQVSPAAGDDRPRLRLAMLEDSSQLSISGQPVIVHLAAHLPVSASELVSDIARHVLAAIAFPTPLLPH